MSRLCLHLSHNLCPCICLYLIPRIDLGVDSLFSDSIGLRWASWTDAFDKRTFYLPGKEQAARKQSRVLKVIQRELTRDNFDLKLITWRKKYGIQNKEYCVLTLCVLPPLPLDQKQGGVRQQTWLW